MIGLINVGGRKWTAGDLYVKSLLYALQSQPEANKIPVCLFENLKLGINSEAPSSVKNVLRFDIQHFPRGRMPEYLLQFYDFLNDTWQQKKWAVWPKYTFYNILSECGIEMLYPANVCLGGRRISTKKLAWIPDFQELHYPEFFQKKEIKARKKNTFFTLRNADKLIVSNEFSARDICKVHPEYAHKIEVLPFVMYMEEFAKNDPAQVVSKYGLPPKYLIFPAQFWIHKNHRCILEALVWLKKKGYPKIPVVFTGPTHDYRHPTHYLDLQKFIGQYGLENQVFTLGVVNRGDLVQLIRASAAVVQPSFFEGHSALLEDCRTLGKITFVSDIPMHREQQPTHARYFNPLNALQLASLIADEWEALPQGIVLNREQTGLILYHENLKKFALKFKTIYQSAL